MSNGTKQTESRQSRNGGVSAPLISVIVPVYKVEPYLSRCLESVCAQTYRNIEIICVDDGSPDRSIDILNDFAAKDLRIRVIRQANQGVSAARNLGIEIAKGEWVTFIDGDDWIESEAYSACIPHLTDEVDMVLFGAYVDNELPLNDPQQSLMAEECRKIEDICHVKYDGIVTFSDEVILTMNTAIWNKLFRRSILIEHNVRFPLGRWYQDCTFNFKFLLIARCGYFLKGLNHRYYHYVQREASTMYKTRQSSPRAMQHLEVISDVYNVIKEYHLEESRQTFLACIADGFINSTFLYTPKELHSVVRKKAGRLIEKIGIDHRTEFASIARVRRSLIYRPGLLLRQFTIRLGDTARRVRAHLARFFFQRKYTKSGRVLIKICKIPVYFYRRDT